MRKLDTYINEKLIINDKVRSKDSIENKVLKYIKSLLTETLSWNYDKDYKIYIKEDENYYYVIIDWLRLEYFDSSEYFKSFYDNITTKISEDIFDRKKIDSSFDFTEKKRTITIKLRKK